MNFFEIEMNDAFAYQVVSNKTTATDPHNCHTFDYLGGNSSLKPKPLEQLTLPDPCYQKCADSTVGIPTTIK